MTAELALTLLPRLARGIALGASLGLFGTLLVATLVVLPLVSSPADGDATLLAFKRLVRIALVVILATTIIWLPSQAVQMAGPEEAHSLAGIVALVATETTFGQALLARLALAIIAVVIAGDLRSTPRLALATALAGASLALQPWLGHAAASGTAWLPVLVASHVVVAGAWIGGLVPLALAVARMPGDLAASLARRFSWIGLASVIALVVSAWLQSAELIGDVGGWFGTPYGLLALAKLLGFALLLLIAAVNRFVLTPALGSAVGRRRLLISIGIETAIGIAVTLAAVALATLPPAAHEQSIWPFPLQPDLGRIDEPYFSKEIWRALALGLAALIGIVTVLWRRTRLLGPLAALLALYWLPPPNFLLLSKPAFATSFQRSETGFTAASIARGAELVAALCTPDCFRPKDDPSDPSPYGLWQRGDGDLYGWLTSVFDIIGHSPFPHGTIAKLEPRQRWQLIDYFRARTAGSTAARSGSWPYPVLAPDFAVTCETGVTSIAELRRQGRLVQVLAQSDDRPAAPPSPPSDIPLTTVLLSATPVAQPPAGIQCLSSSPDAWAALGLMTGLGEAGLDGASVLIDANGWLRSLFLPNASANPAAYAPSWQAELLRISEQPFQAAGIGTHRH